MEGTPKVFTGDLQVSWKTYICRNVANLNRGGQRWYKIRKCFSTTRNLLAGSRRRKCCSAAKNVQSTSITKKRWLRGQKSQPREWCQEPWRINPRLWDLTEELLTCAWLAFSISMDPWILGLWFSTLLKRNVFLTYNSMLGSCGPDNLSLYLLRSRSRSSVFKVLYWRHLIHTWSWFRCNSQLWTDAMRL